MALSIFTDFMRVCKHHYQRRRGKARRRNSTKHHDPSITPVDAVERQIPDQGLPERSSQVPLAENVVQKPISSLVDHNLVPPTTESSNFTDVSASKPEMEHSPPSPRTTGPESPSHDSGSRMSIASSPPEPFPRLHHEPCSPGKSHRLQTPHTLKHRTSDRSARRQYYDQDRDRVIPKEILCYLKVIFDGKPLSERTSFEKLDWQDDASYGTVHKAAQNCLNASPETINKNVWRTDGVCKLFREKQECSSKALETEDQWSEVLHLIIAEFVTIPGNEYAKFHLEITWTYAAVDLPGTEKTQKRRYSREIADLIDSRIKTNWRGRKFIPQKDLHAIMSPSVIEHLINKDESLANTEHAGLGDSPAMNKKKFIDDVASYHKHLLALCVHEDLPLICLWQMLYLGPKPAQFPLGISDKPPAAEKIKFDNLIFKQWFFTAYRFPKPTDAKVHCFDLTDNDILPIEGCGKTKPIGSGAFKTVYEVQIQPGHHRFTADKTSVFALKEFKNGCAFEDFERESKVLRKLVNVPHKHITPHYASWRQGGHFFMLSPLAFCNLKGYWKQERPRLSDPDFVLWELRQLRGLADGLRFIYNLGGWHHDLKGENILVFKEGDSGGPTLKIADFGSAKIRARRSAPRDESSPTDHYSQGTSAYEAPDYVIRGETSRPYDVWTLGCIFLDFLVWTFGSFPSELETFSKQRREIKGGQIGNDTMFWYVERNREGYKTHWKPYVSKRLHELEEQCNSDKGRAVFKELVLTTSKMLRMDPSKRPKPHEVHNDMERMILWAEEAVKEPDWNIQNLLIGSVPSTSKSETSGEAGGDEVPVEAPLGHLMMDNTAFLRAPMASGRNRTRNPLSDSPTLICMGLNENLNLTENGPNNPHLVVDNCDHISDCNTLELNSTTAPTLYGSHMISPDRDRFAEARTAVPSTTASDSHLPPTPHPSIP
ncbi:hypothetical protein EPUS_06089 [Endocarpon pusillum Z07020]|uniref:Protein kinase domain-containing protein n=1 Tax=Endocarpon pusillum (strain Z07020 / HMAS-L-300199) TaxID=1263415 RepID=U1GJK1_ENDPU|nr:uncharacterized protein EPUS_06089 [Endocarpon pusillum Z07020]ERF72333.1 hypothetical protein EPUS_06089 [Endocarpon pusillum Z07020]